MRTVVVALLLVATTCLAGTAHATTTRATSGSGQWDPRVRSYVRFVERVRGLEFDRPVKVRFLDEQAFRRAASEWYDDVSDEDRDLADLESDDLLALGLTTAPVDLLTAEESSDAEDLLGFYEQATQEMTIRGDDLDDVEVQVTLVHELVHALQDQHFDLDRLERRTRSDGESTALGALIEGDATRVEYEYLWSLPQRVQDEYWDATAPGSEAGNRFEPPDGVLRPSWPLVLALWSSLDYDLAPAALDVVVAAHGRRAIDALFRSPPRSEEQILDPVALERDDAPLQVRLPPFAVGETPRGPAADWGAFSWFVLLSSRIPWTDALAAVDGWGGDRYRSYVRVVDGVATECVRMAVTGDTRRDTAELSAAVEAWGEALPAGGAHVSRDGDMVVVSACRTAVPPTSGDDAMELAYERLWERTNQMASLVDRDHPVTDELRCVANALVADSEVRSLLAEDRALTKAEARAVRRAFDHAHAGCG